MASRVKLTDTMVSAHLNFLLIGILWTETGRLFDTAGSHFSISIKGRASEGF